MLSLTLYASQLGVLERFMLIAFIGSREIVKAEGTFCDLFIIQ